MNNNAALGYMILAAKQVGLNKEQIKELESEMRYAMDERAEEEAEDIYNNF